MLLPMFNVLYCDSRNFHSTVQCPVMLFFRSSLISCFPGVLLFIYIIIIIIIIDGSFNDVRSQYNIQVGVTDRTVGEPRIGSDVAGSCRSLFCGTVPAFCLE